MRPPDDRHPAPRVSLGTRQLVTFLRAKSAKNGYCWWKQKTISEGMKRAGMERSLRTVNRQIAEAVAGGLLRSERHGHGNHYTPCYLVEKVAYRETAVEKPAVSAAFGVADTPNWRIAAPPVSITEILKPERLAGNPPQESPNYEAELTAELERSGVRLRPDWKTADQAIKSGLPASVAAAILGPLVLNRALNVRVRRAKSPEDYWFSVVADEFRKATATAPAPAIAAQPETSAPPVQFDHDHPQDHESPGPQLVTSPAKPGRLCTLCGSDGIVNGSPDPAYCECPRGQAAAAKDRGYLEKLRLSTARLGATWLLPDPQSQRAKNLPFAQTPGNGQSDVSIQGVAPRPGTISARPCRRPAGLERAGDLTGELRARLGVAHAGL